MVENLYQKIFDCKDIYSLTVLLVSIIKSQ